MPGLESRGYQSVRVLRGSGLRLRFPYNTTVVQDVRIIQGLLRLTPPRRAKRVTTRMIRAASIAPEERAEREREEERILLL